MDGIKRYHREVGFPEGFEKMMERYFGSFTKVTYSHHAKLETIKDRYQIIPVLQREWLNAGRCFEVFVEGGEIVKAVFRIVGKGVDNCYSVSLVGTVVTVWANKTDDSHRTLRTELYNKV